MEDKQLFKSTQFENTLLVLMQFRIYFADYLQG